MKLITKIDRIRNSCKFYAFHTKEYFKSNKKLVEISETLNKEDLDNITEEKAKKILGKYFPKLFDCEECYQLKEDLVILSDEHGEPKSICKECLIKALNLFN